VKLCPFCRGDTDAVGSFTMCTCTVESLRAVAVSYREKLATVTEERNILYDCGIAEDQDLAAKIVTARAALLKIWPDGEKCQHEHARVAFEALK
jgi:hypothetical protein